jgi:hypothetical protein
VSAEFSQAAGSSRGRDPGPRASPHFPKRGVVVDRELEGVVAKRLEERYRPGERGSIKRKNPDWPRYQAEREAAIRDRKRHVRSGH